MESHYPEITTVTAPVKTQETLNLGIIAFEAHQLTCGEFVTDTVSTVLDLIRNLSISEQMNMTVGKAMKLVHEHHNS